jgi:hypothetical protein
MITSQTSHSNSRRTLIGTLSAAIAVCLMAAPVAAAKTITVKRSFILRPNATITYTVAENPSMSLADAWRPPGSRPAAELVVRIGVQPRNLVEQGSAQMDEPR